MTHMLKLLPLCLMVASIATNALAADSGLSQPHLRLDVGRASAHVSPLLYGLMTEEINYSYDGGLYGELVQNRIFKNSARSPVHWMTVQNPNGGGVEISLDETQPIQETALTTCLRIDIHSASAAQRGGAANDGFWGIPVKPDTVYRASFWAKASGNVKGSPLTLSIEDKSGCQLFALTKVATVSGVWKKYTAILTTPHDVAPTLQTRFAISTESTGTLWLNLVSPPRTTGVPMATDRTSCKRWRI
jgi:alpha-N-arabinofuranosidase